MSNCALIIDFDSTIVTVESLDELARVVLAGRRDKETVLAKLENLTNLGMAGKIAFDESLERRLALFEASQSQVEELTSFLIAKLSPSLRAQIEWIKDKADDIYVVSGGFADYIAPVVAQLGIRSDHVYANKFVYDQRGKVIGYDKTRLTSQPGGKCRQVQALTLTHLTVVMLGDGYTDFEACAPGGATEFWAYTETVARPNVVAQAHRVMPSFAEVKMAFASLS